MRGSRGASTDGRAAGAASRETHLRPPRTDHTPHPRRWLLRAGRPPARWIVRRRFQVRVHHPERMPERGPVLLASNHIGVSDGPLLAIFSPRPVHALTKQEMFSGALGRFLRTAGQFPIDRFHVDPAGVRSCLRVLREDGVLGIFPEGSRGPGDLSRWHRGVAYLALATGAPVLPVAIVGSRRAGEDKNAIPPRGGHVDIVFGQPVHIDQRDWPRTREQVGQVSLFLRERLLETLHDALADTGGELPGPLPPGQAETDPSAGVLEQGA